MQTVKKALADLGSSLCKQVDVGGLFARSATAHKWKAPWRALLLREAVAWRLHDPLEQSRLLAEAGGVLGARVLLRSAFETVAVLVYLNKAMRNVVTGSLSFHLFSEKTTRLLLGSRDKTTSHEAINVMSLLESADKRYPGIQNWYEALCESAHPNYEGIVLGYSTADRDNHKTTFENRWKALYGVGHTSAILACLLVFEGEYNEEWPAAFEALEHWIEQNNSQLEATRPKSDA